MPPFHDPLNIGLLKATHKLHICLKSHVMPMKLAAPKVPREVGAERNGGRLKQSKSLLYPYLKKGDGNRGENKKKRKDQERRKAKKRERVKKKIMMKDDERYLDGLKPKGNP